MHELVRVKEDQLTDLLAYLEKHLPDSWSVYSRLVCSVEGKWDGNTFDALIDTEWPNILAVGEGEVDEKKSKCGKFFAEPRTLSFYAPDKETAKELLMWPGYVDLTKPLLFQAISAVCAEAFMEVSSKEYPGWKNFPAFLCEVKQEDLVSWPIPAGMTSGALTPDMAEYVASTWPHNRPYAPLYVAECIKTFPSVTVLDSDGSVVGFELVKDLGDMGLLYVEEKYRNKGYAKIISSLLAKKCFDEGRRAAVLLLKNNDSSLRLHEAIGFKSLCSMAWHWHPGAEGLSWEELKQKSKSSQKESEHNNYK